MTVLALDTTASSLLVALQIDGKTLTAPPSEGFHHNEFLVPLIETLFSEADASPQNLDLIVCASGPGSFTGLRIGMATAKGIALATGKPMVCVPSLDFYSALAEEREHYLLPLIDARKKRFYTACYRQGERITEYLDLSPEAIAEMIDSLDDEVLLGGPGAKEFMQVSSVCDLSASPEKSPAITASTLIDLGILRWKRDGETPHSAGPLYVRESDAKLQKPH